MTYFLCNFEYTVYRKEVAMMNIEHKDKLFNIPNGLCFFRILLIPLFLIIYFNAGSSFDYLVSGGILIVSGFTDFLDGYIARKYDMITDFGKLIDPIADKLTQLAVAIALVYTYPFAWALVGIIILKDGMLGIVGLYLYQYGLKIEGASWWGKIATAYFYLVVIVLVATNIPASTVSMVLIVTSALCMAFAFVLYAKQLVQLHRHKDEYINEK